jgi:hypothetical protein
MVFIFHTLNGIGVFKYESITKKGTSLLQTYGTKIVINKVRCQWLIHVILAIWEVEVGGIVAAGQLVHETTYQQKKLGVVVCTCHPAMVGSYALTHL